MEGFMTECCRYSYDKGDEKIEEHRPNGFRWLTNSEYIKYDGSVNEHTMELIRLCREIYGDVAITVAFDCTGILLERDIAIYVKAVEPIMEWGNECSNCHKHYKDSDVVNIIYRWKEKEEILCLNCFHIYSYVKNQDGIYVSKYNRVNEIKNEE